MEIQKNISNVAKLGYWLEILVDNEGSITACVFTAPDNMSRLSETVLNPAHETGVDLNEVLKNLVKRLNKQIKEQGNE